MNNNTLAFIALSTEYCRTLENAREMDSREEFLKEMTRLLPRIYISATDLVPDMAVLSEEPYMPNALDEDYYEAIRRNVEYLLEQDDTYLEVFDEDMKYSETPIPMSISETLADIFQPLFNFLSMVKDAPESVVAEGVEAVKSDFDSYWSRKLCNVLRPLNELRYGL